MISISFKSETNEALVGGRERAHMGCLVRDFASAMAGLKKRVQYERSYAQRWAEGMARLREQPLMRMQPSDWATYYCDDGETVFDFMRALNEHTGTPGGIEPRTLA